MGDVVEHKMEEMLTELKLLEKSNIFEAKDLDVITRKKRDFEMKLQRAKKSKTDILEYIQYEMDLLKLVKFKRNSLGIAAKKTSLDYSIASQINSLFNQAIRRYPYDVKLWVTYLKFCRRIKFYTSASRACETMLKLHSDKPSLFKLAAWFEFENENIEKARKHFLTGMQLHKDSEMLHLESIKLELDYISKEKKKNNDDGDDPILKCQLALAIYESAMQKFTKVDFIVELLKVVKQYAFTGELQNKIYDDLYVKFPQEELTWDLVAQKEFENKTTPSKDQYTKLSQTYEKAVKMVNTPLMWKIYIERMLELKDNQKFPNAKRNALTMALCSGNNAGMLTEDDYFLWKEHLQDKDEKRLYKIWKCGTEKLPGSVKLWAERLKWHLNIGDEPGSEEVFNKAINSLKSKNENVYMLWKNIIEFYQCKGDNAKVEQYFEEGVKINGVGDKLKPDFLYWMTFKRGISKTRKLYEKLAIEPPFNQKLHSTMISIEQLQIPTCIKLIRKCHHHSTQQFGEDDVSVWIDFINFEQTQGNPKVVPNIFAQACQILRPSLVESFHSAYSICMANKSSVMTNA